MFYELKIHTYPDRILTEPRTQVVSPLPNGDWPQDIYWLVPAMLKLMKRKKGCGLAAPQVGRSLRLFVTDARYGSPAVAINPQWDYPACTEHPAPVTAKEGCLSLPGVGPVKVTREKTIITHWQDMQGKDHMEELTGIAARIFQHECDHLVGKLIAYPMPSMF